MMVTLYGIKTCDTCRRARKWLDETGIDYQWVDLRENGVTETQLSRWRDVLGDNALINKRSKTWRDFDTGQRQATEDDPIPVLLAHPTLIKRPILETGHSVLAGFSIDRYDNALTGNR